jgi:hypothetical protein
MDSQRLLRGAVDVLLVMPEVKDYTLANAVGQ